MPDETPRMNDDLTTALQRLCEKRTYVVLEWSHSRMEWECEAVDSGLGRPRIFVRRHSPLAAVLAALEKADA